LLGRTEPILITGGRAVAGYKEGFVGIDVAKLRNAVAIADAGRRERFVSSVRSMLQRPIAVKPDSRLADHNNTRKEGTEYRLPPSRRQ
jgi:hypothetical protein